MFKDWTWKQWTAVGIIAAVVITAVVLHLVQPTISYAFLEICSAACFVLGGVTGYLLKKNNIVNKDEKK